MTFEKILGHQSVKKYLQENIENGRIAHAQLFIGEEGIGVLPMAIAYATQIICLEGDENTLRKCENLSHPDLHFAFPTATNSKVKKDPVSSLFMEEWRGFVSENPYGTIFDWYQHIGIENKQGNMGVAEAKEITDKLALKSFEGGYKVMVIWMAELMNTECANKLLKLLEEPPAKTIFILVSQNEHQILTTILSRCQITRFSKLGDATIKEGLMQRGISTKQATAIALRAQGNYKRALNLLENQSDETIFEEWFIRWVRTAFRAKGNKASILGLLQWSEEISSRGREMQKQFLDYCLEIFRQALLLNYGANELIYSQFQDTSFQLEKFAPFIHHNNIEAIQNEIETAIYHIERNGNGKVILTDLSIKLTRLLHTK
ncbi:ATP-binding protein [Capnocytophaga catalasegens]|uniref:DNA polymerase III subunit delta n=1 Tax=Capnocytophaga catalasegens TaxID=1004260 RepID=A0AAV5AX80_9FLAO|nr:DNA polymerase III subunit delta' [Capnocytophaga catalasegens]GIZ14180.1 DNA polymerase III subunit delta' [Capnocytophaga catalasegens]GJM50360.1 DNA polymerase III subunit delta' [Capnocytophaga catalasegens]GJM52642.1 DNA polymerase III subunit delta' [Capnocytophaga catalasegens]